MFEKFLLKDTAFRLTPEASDGVPWYGFQALKGRIEQIIDRSLGQEPRICVLNRGQYGAGKTHAGLHFAHLLSAFPASRQYSKVYSFLIESPKQGNRAFSELFGRIMNAISFGEIRDCSEFLQAQLGVEQLFSRILKAAKNESVAKVLASLNEGNSLVSQTYLSGGGGARDLRALGAATKLSSDHDFAAVLVAIFYLLIHSGRTEAGVNRLILWIDEMEDLVYFPTRYYLPFTQALREVIDRTGSHFTLFLNFTFTEPEDLPTIGSVLGDPIMSRINQHIVFEQSSEEDLRQYLLDLLNDNRIAVTDCPPTHPFDPDSFEAIVAAGIGHTPRFINKVCDSVLRQLLQTPEVAAEQRPVVTRPRLEECLSSAVASAEL
jgi:hypothetical protein